MITHEMEVSAIESIQNGQEVSGCAQMLGYKFDDSFKKCSPLDTNNMPVWTKHIDEAFSISLKLIGKTTSLPVGYILYSKFLKKYTIAHVNDNFLKKSIFSLGNSFSPEWIIGDIFQERLRGSGTIASCVDDDYFGKGSIGSSMFVDKLVGGITVGSFETLRDICIDEFKSNSVIKIEDRYIRCFEVAASIGNSKGS
jgi:hypothetical protein